MLCDDLYPIYFPVASKDIISYASSMQVCYYIINAAISALKCYDIEAYGIV